ncbi:hypothetical protein OAR45_03260 [Candidatus Pelagibacter sp.]|jgi:4-hydroxy 2-oxovalerate aldolase|nr:hypothetical protein [Candidatus Pelagibacter sp.]|tara:strand:- start:907 stop:1932 length:1026 start_codon:yes stop_codon:yes gene_type:complete
MKKKIILSDVSLRDGNHAVSHQIDKKIIRDYCNFCEKIGIDIVEVGHGNGLGASSLSVGRSKVKDKDLFTLARSILKKSKLSIHSIPGFSKINDVSKAIHLGVDIVRVGCNSTDIDISKKQIDYCFKSKVEVWGVLMMFHLVLDKNKYLDKIKFLVDLGIKNVIIMDSAGYMLPQDIQKVFQNIKKKFNINIGMHAHNNLGMAIPNSITSITAGGTILDSSIRGFGAGAGNAQLEVLATVLKRLKYDIKLNFDQLYNFAEYFPKLCENRVEYKNVFSNPENILSAENGIFSGFSSKVDYFSKKFNVSKIEGFKEIGKKKLVAGQEDLIMNILYNLKKTKKK